MKKIYWRPQGMPLYAFILVALFSVGGLAAVEHFRLDAKKPYYREKLAASKLALEAMEIVKAGEAAARPAHRSGSGPGRIGPDRLIRDAGDERCR